MRENKTCPYQGWQKMPTQELDQILQAELKKEHPDEEVVLPILREIEEREKDLPVEKTPEVLEILEKLNIHETSSNKQSIHKRRWLAGIAAAAAAVCIIVMAIPRTVGAESLFDVLFRWTSSIFEFVDPNNNGKYPDVDNTFATDNPGLQELYDKVTALGVTKDVVPMWLPEGFVLTEVQERPMPGGIKVFCKFENGSNVVLNTYRISTDIFAKIEKDESGFEVFEYGEVSHFIVENTDSISVTWTLDGVECVISTDIPKEDIYTILKSIYRSELSQ